MLKSSRILGASGGENLRFLDACFKREVKCTPIWLMRQAGRYMKDYREIRERYSFLEMCKIPEIAAQITLQPLKRFSLDAAIIFSDILIPVEAMGIKVEFVEGKGPQIKNSIKSGKDLKLLKDIEPEEDTSFLLEAIRMVKGEIGKKIPLIGFAGAPFTLASYIIEGGHSRHYLRIKKLMYEESGIFKKLLGKISRNISAYLKAQVKAGADAVQLFDSWAGTLSPADYREYVFPYTKSCVSDFKKAFPDKPLIYFSTGTSGLLEVISSLGSDVVGVDWRVDIKDAFSRVSGKAVQGNLDPVTLVGSKEIVRRRTKEILEKVGKRKGHIFNLGHGVLPQTPEENVGYLVEFVHEYSERIRLT